MSLMRCRRITDQPRLSGLPDPNKNCERRATTAMCAYDESWAVGRAEMTRRSSVSPGLVGARRSTLSRRNPSLSAKAALLTFARSHPSCQLRHTERAQSQVFDRANGIGRVTVSLMVDVKPVADPDHTGAVLVDIDVAGSADVGSVRLFLREGLLNPPPSNTPRYEAVQVDSSGADVSGQPRPTDLLALLRDLCRLPWLIRVAALLAPRAILVAGARLLAYVRPLVGTRSTIRQGVSPPFGNISLLGIRALALSCVPSPGESWPNWSLGSNIPTE